MHGFASANLRALICAKGGPGTLVHGRFLCDAWNADGCTFLSDEARGAVRLIEEPDDPGEFFASGIFPRPL